MSSSLLNMFKRSVSISRAKVLPKFLKSKRLEKLTHYRNLPRRNRTSLRNERFRTRTGCDKYATYFSQPERVRVQLTMPNAPDLLRLDERVLPVFGGFADVEDARVEFAALGVHQKERRAVRVH